MLFSPLLPTPLPRPPPPPPHPTTPIRSMAESESFILLLTSVRCSVCCRRLGKQLLLVAVAVLLLLGVLLSYTVNQHTARPRPDTVSHPEAMVSAGEKNNPGKQPLAADNPKRQRKIHPVGHGRKHTAAKLVSTRTTNTTRKSASTPNTTLKTLSGRERLSAAASAIKVVFVPASYMFSEDVYFHPPRPSSHHAPNATDLLFSPAHICSARGETKSGDDPFLMVLVLSSYLEHSVEERQAIRSTYGSVARGGRWPGKPLAAPVRLVFLLGTPPNETDLQQVKAEVSKFGDLLVADFRDSYRNLTLKVLRGLRWVRDNCAQVKFILKADDDTFVNLPLLVTFLLERGRENSVYGFPYFSAIVKRKGRWAVPQTTYPFSKYPVYMSGTGYVLSKDAAEKIVEASSSIPLIPIEDAFITGILAQVAGISRLSCSGFTDFNEGVPWMCDFVLDTRIVGNKMPAGSKNVMWIIMKIDDRRCEA